jgi:predicted NACHT family NTPase
MTVQLWDSQAGTLLAILKGHSSWVWSVAFSPDGQRLASASMDNTVRLWDIQTGTHLFTLDGHSDDVKSVAFSPDGQWLASASDDRTVRLWDTKAGNLLLTLKESQSFRIADSSTLYTHLRQQHHPFFSGLVRVELTGQSLLPNVVQLCWFPSSWQVSEVYFDSTCSLVAVTCQNGKLYILDISETL